MPTLSFPATTPPAGVGTLDQRPADRPAAASTALRGLLDSGAAGEVLAVFPTAVYVAFEAGVDRDATVAAVVARDGVRMPNALTIAAASSEFPFAVHTAGDPARAEDGCLQIGAVRYHAARSWSPRRVRTTLSRERTQPAVRELAGLLDAQPLRLDGPVASAAARLREALVALDGPAANDAADGLLGLGRGLTPAGDDVLAGVLVACEQLGGMPGAAAVAALATQLGRYVAWRAPTRTTSLSATLLAHAARGEAADPVVAVAEALAGIRPLEAALRDLLTVGHSSGHDTARGLLAGTQALMAHSSLGRHTTGGNAAPKEHR
jgi:hypothetical protein